MTFGVACLIDSFGSVAKFIGRGYISHRNSFRGNMHYHVRHINGISEMVRRKICAKNELNRLNRTVTAVVMDHSEEIILYRVNNLFYVHTGALFRQCGGKQSGQGLCYHDNVCANLRDFQCPCPFLAGNNATNCRWDLVLKKRVFESRHPASKDKSIRRLNCRKGQDGHSLLDRGVELAGQPFFHILFHRVPPSSNTERIFCIEQSTISELHGRGYKAIMKNVNILLTIWK